MGNRRSVEKALEHVGARAQITADHQFLRDADALVVPGVGAFPAGMARLRALGLDELITERARAGTPDARVSAWACSCCSIIHWSSSRPTASV